MNRETLIENTLVYVKDFFKDDYSGYDDYHTLRVYKMDKKIGEQEKGRYGTCTIVCFIT